MNILNLPNCDNAPRQKELLSFIIEELEAEGYLTLEFEMLLSHGKWASAYLLAEDERGQYKLAYFAVFAGHKKESPIKEVRRVKEKISQ